MSIGKILTDAPLHDLGGPVPDLGHDRGVHVGIGGEGPAVGGRLEGGRGVDGGRVGGEGGVAVGAAARADGQGGAARGAAAAAAIGLG